MAIATHHHHSLSTMINAAFLQEVKEANVELWEVIHELRHLVEAAASSAANARRLVSLLGQLRDQLAFAFSLEEAYGYIDGCRGIAPTLAQRTHQARQQHRELYLRIHELCETAEEAQYRGVADREFSELLAATAEFDEQFRAHEQLEADLLTDGLNL